MMHAVQPGVGILGGTFDPIHCGHLHVASLVQRALNLQQVRFIPCKQPVLKSAARASAAQRLAMLEQALAETSRHFIADSRELDRDTPSYMVETLQSLRQQFPQQPLCLILGMDAFAQLPQWHQWRALLGYCHLVVVNREQYPCPNDLELKHLLSEREVKQSKQLQADLAGHILQLELPLMPLSSSNIRQAIAEQRPPIDWLPLSVWKYIRQQGLYQTEK